MIGKIYKCKICCLRKKLLTGDIQICRGTVFQFFGKIGKMLLRFLIKVFQDFLSGHAVPAENNAVRRQQLQERHLPACHRKIDIGYQLQLRYLFFGELGLNVKSLDIFYLITKECDAVRLIIGIRKHIYDTAAN